MTLVPKEDTLVVRTSKEWMRITSWADGELNVELVSVKGRCQSIKLPHAEQERLMQFMREHMKRCYESGGTYVLGSPSP